MAQGFTPFFVPVLLAIACSTTTTGTSEKTQGQRISAQLLLDPDFGWIARDLNNGDPIDSATIDSLAADPALLEPLHEFLVAIGRPELLSERYVTIDKFAASRLANWLVHPSELDTFPDQLVLLGKEDITQNDSVFTYLVFKFKKDPPHWVAEDGWMLGVVGPYLPSSSPTSWPEGTFSRFTKLDSGTSRDEALWTHDNVYRRAP
jgi:hypothetical protein